MDDNVAPISDHEYGEVLDTKKVFLQTLKKKSKKIIFLIVLIAVWVFLCISFLPEEVSLSVFGILIITLPPLFFIAWLGAIYSQIREDFWKQLALKYKWEYTHIKDISGEKALLFTVGHSKRARNGIKGSYKDHDFHIFEYSYTVGRGKQKTTYSLTVFEIKFRGTFPHLYLNYRNDGYANTPSMFSSLAKISLPSEFENKFKLYSPKEYEIETLQIFTHDILALLIDSKWDHDMEFVDGELVIYRKEKFSNFRDLDTELDKIKKFVDILSPLLNRLELTQIGDISPLLKN